MAYLNKYNHIIGNVGNKPISFVNGFDQSQQSSFLYEPSLGGGINVGGISNAAGLPYGVNRYNMYPQQQYNLKMGGTQEQAAEYGPPHYTGAGSGNSGYGVPRYQGAKNKIKGTALSALTLLAFLYFLNLLQTCLRDQMNTMNPTVLVMTAGSREGISKIDRISNLDDELEVEPKIDRTNTKTKPVEPKNKNEVQWKLPDLQRSSIMPKLQNMFLQSQSWG